MTKTTIMRPNLLPLCLAVISASCHHVYYAPNTANAPLLNQKGETRVNALYCSGGDSEYNGGEVQAAYAVSKNIGVMANFFSAGKSEEVYNYSSDQYHDEEGKGSYVEFAGGYFQALGKSKWIGEIYGGTGFGSVKNEYGFGDRSKVGVLKFFIQPAVGYKAKHFEFAIVPKVSLVNWNVKENHIVAPANESARYELGQVNNKKNFVVFEPAVLIRAGGSDFKFQLGLSFSGHNRYNTESLTETFNGSFGISLDLKSSKKNY
jgi:hypothetical protein